MNTNYANGHSQTAQHDNLSVDGCSLNLQLDMNYKTKVTAVIPRSVVPHIGRKFVQKNNQFTVSDHWITNDGIKTDTETETKVLYTEEQLFQLIIYYAWPPKGTSLNRTTSFD